MTRNATLLLAATALLALSSCQTHRHEAGLTCPTPHLEHPPQYMPPSPPMRAPGVPTLNPPAVGVASVPSMPPMMPMSPATGSVVGGATGAAIGALVGAQSDAAPAKKATLAIANLRAGAVKLFTVNAQGELAFVREVPVGEVVDVETAVGTRYAVVFDEKPHSGSFRVKSEADVWLLRGPKPKVTTSSLPPMPALTN